MNYLGDLEVPSSSDIRAMEEGRAEIARGEFLSVVQLRNELDGTNR